MKNIKSISFVELFIGTIFLFLFIVYFSDFFTYQRYTIIRNKLSYKEPFISYPIEEVSANNDTSYSLLEGVLPIKENQVRGDFNSQSCFEQNFESRLERTGNFTQRTNNYRHEDPESCTTLYQEFVGAFYKVDPLPSA